MIVETGNAAWDIRKVVLSRFRVEEGRNENPGRSRPSVAVGPIGTLASGSLVQPSLAKAVRRKHGSSCEARMDSMSSTGRSVERRV